MTNPLYIPPALPVDRPGPSQSFKPSHAPADPALLALLLGYWLAADALATRLIASRCWCSPSRVEVRTGHRDRPSSSSVACAPVGPIIGRHGYRHHAPPTLFLLAAALAAGLALAEDRIWIQEFLTKATAG